MATGGKLTPREEEEEELSSWPTISDTYRPRLETKIVYPGTPDVSSQRAKKKRYEEGRRRSPEGHELPRCPAARIWNSGGGQRQTARLIPPTNPLLFTVPKLLTVVECNELIQAAQGQECRSRSSIDDHCDGCIYRSPEHFHNSTRIRDCCYHGRWLNNPQIEVFSSNLGLVPGLANTLWRRGLSVVFENIRFEEWEEVPAIALIGHAHITRYEKGGGCGLHSHNSWIYPEWPRPPKRERHRQRHMFTPEPVKVSLGDKSHNEYEHTRHLMQGVSFQGYDVIVYLNGEGRDGSHLGEDESVCNTRKPASGSAKTANCPLVGGETVFYSERYSGNIPMATIAPVAGMAVCHTRGLQCPQLEHKPVTEGVKYVMHFSVFFSQVKETPLPKRPDRKKTQSR